MPADFYCCECNNTGMVDCYCGGDLCVCENNGEEPCPHCDGGEAFFRDDDYNEDVSPKPESP